MTSIELCAGAGGLALATTKAGFRPLALLERDEVACVTLSENRGAGHPLAANWPIVAPTDLTGFDYTPLGTGVDLLSGGPPCQPFSQGGKCLGIEDERDLFGEVARAVRELRPRAILIENTKGLAARRFQRQLRHICLQLSFPERHRKPGENWERFTARLERLESRRPSSELRYTVSLAVLNAADHGVPQRRERLFIVGFLGSGLPPFDFPTATHSLDALLHQQWVSGAYWERHRLPVGRRPKLPAGFRHRLATLAAEGPPAGVSPWVTVRDAISDLPPPVDPSAEADPLNHRFQPGARAYPRHTGSSHDFPAKVIKAGRHGVPGGENMLAFEDGAVRYFTIRECARLQTFPDDYRFSGPWTRLTRQLGNAVPVLLGQRVAESVRRHLDEIGNARGEAGVATPARRPSRRDR